MRGVNKDNVIGNATHDVEPRHSQNGKPVSRIRLATNHLVKDQEETPFHAIVCWDRLAETMAIRALRVRRRGATDRHASLVTRRAISHLGEVACLDPQSQSEHSTNEHVEKSHVTIVATSVAPSSPRPL